MDLQIIHKYQFDYLIKILLIRESKIDLSDNLLGLVHVNPIRRCSKMARVNSNYPISIVFTFKIYQNFV